MTLIARVGVELDGFSLDVDLAVPAGETVAVVGPNGAGKTTLLRAVAGLRALSSGRLEVDGRVLDDPATGAYLAPERRPIGVVFQDHLLFPHLDALDNVAFGLRAQGHRRRDARRLASRWLERVGLAGREAARPHELSGGQAQRVALARALAPEPSLLLLDETLAALDATTRHDVRSELRRHLATFSGVALLVTHDPLDAAVLADRVVVLDRGGVVQAGTPAEITGRPRSRWAADFAGTNLYAGERTDDGVVRLVGGGVLIAGDTGPPGAVLAVVHPRAVVVHRSRPDGSARNTWPGRVGAIEAVGDRRRIRVDGVPPIVAEVTGQAALDVGLAEDADVWVAVKATEVECYPA